MMTQKQLELGLANRKQMSARGCNGTPTLNRANWWFGQMRQVVDRAFDWEPAPRFQPEQILFGQGRPAARLNRATFRRRRTFPQPQPQGGGVSPVRPAGPALQAGFNQLAAASGLSRGTAFLDQRQLTHGQGLPEPGAVKARCQRNGKDFTRRKPRQNVELPRTVAVCAGSFCF